MRPMKLAILSRAPRSYSTQRLRTAALDRGHDVKVLNTLRFGIDLTGDEPDLQFRGKQLSDYDAVLPRIGNSITYFGTAVVRQFEQMDVYTPNTRQRHRQLAATSCARRRSCRATTSPMPATTFVQRPRRRDPGDRARRRRAGRDQAARGHAGHRRDPGPDVKVAEAIIETLQSTRQNVLIQRFVTESKGRDIRALVVGDRVVAAMRRVAQGDEFRSNVHRGGSGRAGRARRRSSSGWPCAPRRSWACASPVSTCSRATSGPLVMEVNSSPGLEGIEAATKLDVAGAIVDYIANQVAFPEIDVRQRLTVSTGYGVAEIVVHAGADMVGKTLGDSGLDERDITVLTLHRGTQVIPNPRNKTVLEADDRLLCFGKLEEMRSMIPDRKQKRVRRLMKKHLPPESS